MTEILTEIESLHKRINMLRRKMELLACHKGCLTDAEVLSVSQKIDVLVNLYLKIKITQENEKGKTINLSDRNYFSARS